MPKKKEEEKKEAAAENKFIKQTFDAFQKQLDSGSPAAFKDSVDFLEKLIAWTKKKKVRTDKPVKDLIYEYLDELEYFVTDLDRAVVKLEAVLSCTVTSVRQMKTKYTIGFKKGTKRSTAFITLDFKRWGYGEIEVADL